MPIRNILIFGATSAIAQEALRVLVQRGASVYCVGRSPDRLSAVIADLRVRAGPGQTVDGQGADLLDTDRHPALFTAAREALGDLDAVLIAHGTLPDQAQCEASVERTLAAIAENGTSAVSLLTIAGNELSARGSGVIAAISSVAGDRGRQSNYVYGASKSLVSTFMQGLRNRLAHRGVRVVTIKPGFIDTPMTAAFPKGGPLWTTAARAGRAVADAMEKGRDVAYVPGYWFWIMTILRHVPERIFKHLKL
jgi:hypothetical protein